MSQILIRSRHKSAEDLGTNPQRIKHKSLVDLLLQSQQSSLVYSCDLSEPLLEGGEAVQVLAGALAELDPTLQVRELEGFPLLGVVRLVCIYQLD